MGALDVARSGFEACKARTREVIKLSGDGWKENDSDRPLRVDDVP